MSVVITLSDDLAAQLQSRAALEQMTVEEYAVHVLADAAERPLDPEKWAEHNRRRLELIRQQFAAGLAAAEAQELQHLQGLADRQLERLDQQMLADVEQLAQAARREAGRP